MSSTAERLARFAATVLDNPWIPKDHRIPQPPDFKPTPLKPQAIFLMLDCYEALYGGAAGGGKSDALLMAALQYVDVPGYNALVLRKTFTDLSQPNALMNRARAWLAGTAAEWKEREHSFRFPSGASLTFGFLDNPGDEYRYQGAEYQFIGVDELTQIRENQFRYLFSRLRRLANVDDLPLRMRCASNPGGAGHDWVRQRYFVEGPSRGRVFIPANLRDNVHLDADTYILGLNEQDAVQRAQLLHGDWNVRNSGGKLRREWFSIIPKDKVPAGCRWVRYWDLASTSDRDERKGRKKDPDWTAGAMMGELDGRFYVLDVRRLREEAPGVERALHNTAAEDRARAGYHPTVIEQEGGSAGKIAISHFQRHVLAGYEVYGDHPTGSKVARAGPFIAAASAGNVFLVEGPWIRDFLDEAEMFPLEGHDDQVDCCTGAFNYLNQGYGGEVQEGVLTCL